MCPFHPNPVARTDMWSYFCEGGLGHEGKCPSSRDTVAQEKEKMDFFFFFLGGIVFPCPGSNLGHSSDSTES